MIDTFVTQSQLVSFQPIKSVHDHRLIFEPINQINVIQLRYLNSVLFPLVYKDHFYAEVLKMECFCQLVKFENQIVGTVCCRPSKEQSHDSSFSCLYIMTLGVLAPYRRLGIGRAILQYVFLYAKQKEYKQIRLHVQINNHAALSFYQNHGFTKESLIEHYYKRLEPSSAYLLIRQLQ